MIAMGHMAGRHEICPYGALPPIAYGVFVDGGDRGINERNVGIVTAHAIPCNQWISIAIAGADRCIHQR